jgi:hypothetical protein
MTSHFDWMTGHFDWENQHPDAGSDTRSKIWTPMPFSVRAFVWNDQLLNGNCVILN